MKRFLFGGIFLLLFWIWGNLFSRQNLSPVYLPSPGKVVGNVNWRALLADGTLAKSDRDTPLRRLLVGYVIWPIMGTPSRTLDSSGGKMVVTRPSEPSSWFTNVAKCVIVRVPLALLWFGQTENGDVVPSL